MSRKDSNDQGGSGWLLAGGLLLGGAAAMTLGYAVGRNVEQPQRQCIQSSSSQQPRQQSREYEENVVKTDKCAICLRDMDIIVLPCKHAFDEGCIKTWIETNGTCPICRAPVS